MDDIEGKTHGHSSDRSRKTKIHKENNEEEGNTREEQRINKRTTWTARWKHSQTNPGTQLHTETMHLLCYHWKQTNKKKPKNICHNASKIESKGHKSYGQFSRNLERKNKKTASTMLY